MGVEAGVGLRGVNSWAHTETQRHRERGVFSVPLCLCLGPIAAIGREGYDKR